MSIFTVNNVTESYENLKVLIDTSFDFGVRVNTRTKERCKSFFGKNQETI